MYYVTQNSPSGQVRTFASRNVFPTMPAAQEFADTRLPSLFPRVLAHDSGEVRGLLLAQCLQALEQATPDCPLLIRRVLQNLSA